MCRKQNTFYLWGYVQNNKYFRPFSVELWTFHSGAIVNNRIESFESTCYTQDTKTKPNLIGI